ncbi:HemK family modification methylase [Marinobacter lipolyticus SM19]|uniref:Release factor glutamine methyltransferase n=1 Tax=Marinobacter lipolyticus SM19 TaxID=1318628 RepID=R8AYV9_9GAMM|nr:peptide chain release factor N(5)-glutamine methyltransferase [Marinobacter lipolyticus]EON91526.1 HemK family modification methylase [Marinobacter lipolyticus SM19]
MIESSITRDVLLRKATIAIAGESPRLDAELLLSYVTGLSRTSFRAWPERQVTATEARRFEALVEQRANGHPVAHLLGEQEFWSLPLKVNASTLIPRPDTECLVEVALVLPLPDNAQVLDLGTGTGAIALALASERHHWQVLACDAVASAVELATENARRLGLPVTVVLSHWFDNLPAGRFDLIVSNPPYIASGDHHLGEGDVRFEPASALVAGGDGLDDIRAIVATSADWLNAGGWLVVEHGFDQGDAVRALFGQAGLVAVETRKDYGNRDRLTLGQWPG